MNFVKKYTLEIVSFLGGASVMILELSGSRVVAPYLGTSIFVWTNLIGVILASLSLGYYLGGRIADKNPTYKKLALIIFIAAILIAAIAVIQRLVLFIIQAHITDMRLGAFIAALIFFAAPSVLLGMIAPYAVRLKIKDIQHAGTTVGNLYAISTVGSIIGTFATGFFLIPFFGVTRILIVLSIILIIASAIAHARTYIVAQGIATMALLGLIYSVSQVQAEAVQKGFIDRDTQYNRVWIRDSIDSESNRPLRSLSVTPRQVESQIFTDTGEPMGRYIDFYHLAPLFNPEMKSALMIGGAGYSFARDYLSTYKDATLDVVEIDPGLTQLAREYFHLEDDPRLTIIHEDGRTFLNNNTNTYDAMFGDAYDSFFDVPFQLTTKEAIEHIYNALTDDGVMVLNIISTFNKERGRFLYAQYNTIASIFPHISIFPVQNPKDAEDVQNIIVIASKKKNPDLTTNNEEFQNLLAHKWEGSMALDIPVLTDNFAPVEHYNRSLLR